MKRVIVDYSKIPEEILQKLVEKYPEGYTSSDIVTFVNAKGEKVEAVELKTEDTFYLVKISQKLEDKMDDFVADDDDDDDDDDFDDDFDDEDFSSDMPDDLGDDDDDDDD